METLISGKSAYPPALVLHARLMYRAGEVQTAVASYRDAVDQNDEIADPQLEDLLGIRRWNAETSDDMPSDEESEIVDGRIRQGATPASGADDAARGKVERPQLTFDDVGGMDKVKEQIEVKIIHPLQHAEMYAAYGKKIGGGILMYGPPGCGKVPDVTRGTSSYPNLTASKRTTRGF